MTSFPAAKHPPPSPGILQFFLGTVVESALTSSGIVKL